MNRLIVKNFGPIKDLDINVKDISVFIGTTGSGKSTAAKLISIFREHRFLQEANRDTFDELLKAFNIDFPLTAATEIKYCYGNYYWQITPYSFNSNFPFTGDAMNVFAFNSWAPKEFFKIGKQTFPIGHLVYFHSLGVTDLERVIKAHKNDSGPSELPQIVEDLLRFKREDPTPETLDFVLTKATEILPLVAKFIETLKEEFELTQTQFIAAERILLSMVGESVFGLIKNDVAIAKCFTDFAANFETARKEKKALGIDFLDATYQYLNNENVITLGDGNQVKLNQASSGLQSVIPLLLVLFHKGEESMFKQLFVIEEPELNLYPTIQHQLVETIIEQCQKRNDNLIITTHSPYILSTLDNLLKSGVITSENPGLAAEVEKIIPKSKWIQFEQICCYYFDNGSAMDILNYEHRAIDTNSLDDISIHLASINDKLLNLQYQ
jgi:hypothetical protein